MTMKRTQYSLGKVSESLALSKRVGKTIMNNISSAFLSHSFD